MTDFILSTSTLVSIKEIRSIIQFPMSDGSIAFACGDRNSYIHCFKYDPSTKSYARFCSFKAHGNTVSSLCYLPPCAWMPNGAIVTGSMDKTICVWSTESLLNSKIVEPKPSMTLTGHTDNICCLAATSAGLILSSSWDGTAKVWSMGVEAVQMKHEQYGIWSIISLPGAYATLGADKTLRLWDLSGNQLQKYENAHSDVLRQGIFIESQSILITIGNDGFLKSWIYDQSSHTLTEARSIQVSDTYIYTISQIDATTFAVAGEDKCSYIVSISESSVYDVIPVPGVIWCLTTFSNGDLALASTDGYVRTFTVDASRAANKEMSDEFIESLANLTFSSQQLQEVNILDLEDAANVEAREVIHGRFELLRSGDDKVLYVFNRGLNRWLKVGTLTKTKGSQSQKVQGPDGKQYDFCFNVDVEDRGTTYPIYLNYDTNEFVAAHDFLVKHNLPLRYLDEVANFIRRERKPYTLNVDSRPKKSSIFPMTVPVYTSGINIDQLVAKLKSVNKPLTADDFSVISSWPSDKWFDVVGKALKEWKPTESWPLMDLLRERILSEDSTKFIPTEGISQIIDMYLKSSDVDDFSEMGLMRVIGNLTKNYTDLALNNLNLGAIFRSHSVNFKSMKARTQIAFAGAMMNLSMCCGPKTDLISDMSESILSCLNGVCDEEAQFRLLYAAGNLIVTSSSASSIFTVRPDVFDRIRASASSQKIAPVLDAVIQLIV